MAVLSWALALALMLLSRPASASTEGEDGMSSGALPSLSVTILATFDLAQSQEKGPSPPSTEDLWAQIPIPSWRMAGFCDARGASAVAPLPALPVEGTWTAAQPLCQEYGIQEGGTIEHHKDQGTSSSQDVSDLALLPMVFWYPIQNQPVEVFPSMERNGMLSCGFARGIEEPPQS